MNYAKLVEECHFWFEFIHGNAQIVFANFEFFEKFVRSYSFIHSYSIQRYKQQTNWELDVRAEQQRINQLAVVGPFVSENKNENLWNVISDWLLIVACHNFAMNHAIQAIVRDLNDDKLISPECCLLSAHCFLSSELID